MRSGFLCLLLLICLGIDSFACTGFFINKNGELLFGRNYDWVTANGMICTNLRGVAKTSIKTNDGEKISWVSTFGSITFNQYGKEFPTGGMNEKGLVVELMWLDGTQYPKADARPAVGVLQWIQYQLDNYETIEGVISSDSKIRISSVNTSPLHYLIADATGHAAAIEFIDGKMKVYTGNDLPFAALTNDRYDVSLHESGFLNNNSPVSISNVSILRFQQTCRQLQFLNNSSAVTDLNGFAFSILNMVAQPNTQWSIVYDLKNKLISFRSTPDQQVKSVSFSDFDFNCTAQSMFRDINQQGKGRIIKDFSAFTLEVNEKFVNRSFDESVSRFIVSPERRQIIWRYPDIFTCAK